MFAQASDHQLAKLRPCYAGASLDLLQRDIIGRVQLDGFPIATVVGCIRLVQTGLGGLWPSREVFDYESGSHRLMAAGHDSPPTQYSNG